MLLELVHTGERYINFKLDGNEQIFRVDPNRIYTKYGRETDEGEERYGGNKDAVKAVQLFSESLLKEIAGVKVVIAVHNNRGLFMEDCLPGNQKENIYDTHQFPSDFFLVTKKEYFNKFKEKKFNVILQNNQKVLDDGSLSVYFKDSAIPYINVEVKSIDRLRGEAILKQVEMLDAALEASYALLLSGGA